MTTNIHDDYERDDYRRAVITGDDFDRLDEIAARLHPCSPPDVMNGYDLCPCDYGGTWPCAVTEAAWLARGLDPRIEATRILSALVAELVDGGDAA